MSGKGGALDTELNEAMDSQRRESHNICSVEDCGRMNKAHGYCQQHHRRYLNYGTATPEHLSPLIGGGKSNSGANCQIEGCDRKNFSRGYCQQHYARLRNFGSPTPEHLPMLIREQTPGGGPRECEVEGCSTQVKGGGLCSAHRRREKLYGTPTPDHLPISTQVPHECEMEDCDKEARIAGFCLGHYQVVKHDANREHLLHPDYRAARCLLPDCENPQYSQGLCRNHGLAAERGSLELPEEDTKPLKGFGERLRLCRAIRGYTLAALGERMGVTRERIRQLEAREYAPRPETLQSLALALEQSVERLVGVSLDKPISDKPVPTTPVPNGEVGHKPKGYRKKNCPTCDGAGTFLVPEKRGRPPLPVSDNSERVFD